MESDATKGQNTEISRLNAPTNVLKFARRGNALVRNPAPAGGEARITRLVSAQSPAENTLAGGKPWSHPAPREGARGPRLSAEETKVAQALGAPQPRRAQR